MDKTQKNNTFADDVIEKVEMLKTTGKIYRRKLYNLDSVVNFYIDNMKIKYANMGEKYLSDMINNINTIFNNISRTSKYDILEFVNIVVEFCFKHLAYIYKLSKNQPKLPDYTLPEIKEMAHM